MAIFKPKPMAKPIAAKPIIAPRPVAPKPIAAKPVIAPPTPQPVVGKKDAFYSSPEYKGFQKDSAGKPATMDMYNSPYFGSVGSGSVGRAQDAAYRKYKGIAEPTPVGGPVGTSPAPFGGGGGYAAGPGPVQGIGSAMSGPKVGLGTAMGMNKMGTAGAALLKPFGMKKGGKVSSASSRADGIAVKGKTKGRVI